MDDDAELEQLARDMASIKVELFENSLKLVSLRAEDLAKVDFVISDRRECIQEYQHALALAGNDWLTGELALTLAQHLLFRFHGAQRKESNDLQEAKDLEVIISRHNHNINNESHEHHYHWQLYKQHTARADLMVAFQKMETRLIQLRIHQVAQSLLSSHQIEAFILLMDEKIEPERLARDVASVKVRLFVDSNDTPRTQDALILGQRRSIELHRHARTFVRRDKRVYGNIALSLAVLLVSRFATAGREISDLQEAKELEVIISRNNCDINSEGHDDYHKWQKYKWLIARADLMVTFRKLETQLAQLEAHQAQPLDLSHQTQTSALPRIKPNITTPKPNAQVPYLSKTTNSLVVVTDTDHNLLPSPSQLDSPQPTSLSSIPSSETPTVDLSMKALFNASDETEIRDYAIYCQVLAQFYFSRYRMVNSALDLEEAVEYSVTAYQLFADIADVSLSLMSRTMAILLACLPGYLGEFPQLPRVTVMETFEELTNRFSETTQTFALGLAHQAETKTSVLPHTKPPFATSEPDAPGTALSDAMDSIAVTDADHDRCPSPAQLDSSQSRSTTPLPTILSNEISRMDSSMKALLDANDETDITMYAVHCHVLAQCFFSRYQLEKEVLDLEEAAEYSVTAFWLFADTDGMFLQIGLTLPRIITYLTEYLSVYRHASFLPLPSINILETLATLIDDSDFGPQEPYEWRLDLGLAFFKVYSKTKSPLHAEMAITQYGKAFECQLPTSDLGELWVERRCVAHLHLATMLTDRYGHSGDSSDIDITFNNLRSIKAQISDPAVQAKLGPVFHPAVEACEGRAFRARFFRQPDAASLEDQKRVILSYQSLTPESRYSISPMGYVMGEKLLLSYSESHRKTDLIQSIQYFEEQILQDPHPPRIVFLKLADAYAMRSADGDQLRAFQCFQAVAEEDRRNPRHARETDEYTSEMMPRTREEYRRCANRPFQGPSTQFRWAHIWGHAVLEQDHPDCVEAFRLAASVLPEVQAADIGNKIEEAHKTIRDTQAFGGYAAAAAVKFATASLAVEWLELGMAVTTRQIYHLRLDVGDLETRHPDHFETLKRLSEELRQLSGGLVPTSGSSAFVGANKRKARQAYESNLKEIRRKPGMKDFLRPLRFPQIAEVACHGPVILLSCDDITEKTYAFIILNPSRTEPIALPLPRASYEDLAKIGDNLRKLVFGLRLHHRSSEGHTEQLERGGRVSERKGPDFETVLEEIWMRVVKPVFDELEKNDIKLGRVWWCPSAMWNGFPLHAAAPVDCPYISSYTYGLEILLNARARLENASFEQSASSKSQLSVVGMGVYPGRPYLTLPSVSREVQILSDLMEGNTGIAIHKIENDEASVDAVLSALKSSQFVHLACHGTQDLEEPLDSHLALTDGKLELRKILVEDLRSADFAFLSACQTATSGANILLNESLHLAGGFVAAGFKGVIGTFWRISDDDAPGVVRDVYEAMKVEGGLDITLAAEGLDRAVKRMRKEGVPAHRWVPFVHVGV
ncbi:hypothetical protein NP233_g9988 [Leucocoprinus birnbaumii]|uniref:CHAT domain-containing protein n=1 Tax=Leucocoprinus birnbaumii TaxID=56174 RepID=A0AAD5VQ14_9AGAR|nr:hypothetical protein NP233_g9988 [Leucocoprinus birnbaumii]